MNAIIIVTDEHEGTLPLMYNLGDHTLIITNDYGNLAAFELAAPRVDIEEQVDSDTPKQELTILDHDETYNLYQCLHTLFHPVKAG